MNVRKRKGRIDEVDDLKTMDLVAFNGGVNPWNNSYITGGFRPGAAYFRSIVEKWGFNGLRSVVDVGSGYGRWSVFLGEVNTKVCGFERNPGAVELSRKLVAHFGLSNVTFDVADVTKLPVKNSSVEGAWCFNGLHLFPRAGCLAEIWRVLKPGASLFLGAYNGLGAVMEKFFEGYRKNGLNDFFVKYALGALKNCDAAETPGFNYCSPSAIGAVLKEFGFELSTEHPLEQQYRGGVTSSDLFAAEMCDMPAFAKRLEEDETFRTEFALHPEIANRYPLNVNLLAIKR